MDLILGVNKGSILNVPKSKDGAKRDVDGPIVCTATPDGIVHLSVNPDGSVADVVPVAVGTATYSTSADANLDPTATNSISGNLITINVAPAPIPMADHIESTEGPVVPQ